jgi:hypothetical protein
MKEKIYDGLRTPTGAFVTVNGSPLNPRLKVRNHSPTGFEWGYGGSGPAQLSLAILCNHLGNEEEALGLYQDFKFAVIGRIKDDSWRLTTRDVSEAIEKIRERRSA